MKVGISASNRPQGLEPIHSRQLTQGCVYPESLETSFEADTVVFGTMFTIEIHADPISLMTMEISANPLTTEMGVEIYTKLGSYEGFENNSVEWTKIVDTTVAVSHDGRGTLIPANEFSGFTMSPLERRSFFVTLKTSDLRYKRGGDYQTGQTFLSDAYLSMNVGIGLGGYGFGRNQVFPDRMFTGILHYTRAANCDDPRRKSLIKYSFYARQEGREASEEEIIAALNTQVTGAVQNILGSSMAQVTDDHAIIVENVESARSVSAGDGCPVANWPVCVSIVVDITLSHRTTIAGGRLQYLMLHQVQEVTDRVEDGTLEVEYFGDEGIETTILVALKGVPAGIPMDDQQKKFVEEITTEYLKEQSVGLSNAVVIGTKITSQRGPGFQKNRHRRLQDGNAAEGWIELSMDVLAMFEPPYVGNEDFFSVVETGFGSDYEAYVESLKAGRHRPSSPLQGSQGDYFLGIDQVLASNPDAGPAQGNSPTNPPKNLDDESAKILGLNPTVLISICVCTVAVTIIYIWYVMCWKSSNDEEETKGESQFNISAGPSRSHSLESGHNGTSARRIGAANETGTQPRPHSTHSIHTTESKHQSSRMLIPPGGEQYKEAEQSKRWRDGTLAAPSKSVYEDHSRRSARTSSADQGRSKRNITSSLHLRSAEAMRSTRNMQVPSSTRQIAATPTESSQHGRLHHGTTGDSARSSRNLTGHASSSSSGIPDRSMASMRRGPVASSSSRELSSSPATKSSHGLSLATAASHAAKSSRGGLSSSLPPRSALPTRGSQQHASSRPAPVSGGSNHSRNVASTHTRSSNHLRSSAHSSRSMRSVQSDGLGGSSHTLG